MKTAGKTKLDFTTILFQKNISLQNKLKMNEKLTPTKTNKTHTQI